MFARQVPASAILLDGQSMAGIEMPLDHLAAPAALQANDNNRDARIAWHRPLIRGRPSIQNRVTVPR